MFFSFTVCCRRDSFVTHRAFCDALAEEAARVNAASSMLHPSNTVSYPFLGSSMCPTLMSTQNFSSIFKPISASADDLTKHMDQGAGAACLSLWMGGQPPSQTQQESLQNQIPRLSYSDVSPLISCSNPPPPNQNYHLNQLLSVPSLYSTEQHVGPRAPNTSATALLQKAAQIGVATSSTTGSGLSFTGSSFGSKVDSNTLGSQLQGGDDSKLSGLYEPSVSTLTGLGSDQSLLDSSSSVICPLTTPPIYPPAKRQNTQSDGGTRSGGQTRDFLGVGVHTICNPSSINGWIWYTLCDESTTMTWLEDGQWDMRIVRKGRVHNMTPFWTWRGIYICIVKDFVNIYFSRASFFFNYMRKLWV